MVEWQCQLTELDAGGVLQGSMLQRGIPASYQQVMQAFGQNANSRLALLTQLQELECEGFFWEVKPVTRDTLQQRFEFVVVPSKSLPRLVPEPEAFREHFVGAASVVSFDNLGGDAQLVVPCPITPGANYAHFKAFLRAAPLDQQQELLRQVGEAVSSRVGTDPLWLSTAGMGVSWLHIRLDSRPKYYRYQPYKRFP